VKGILAPGQGNIIDARPLVKLMSPFKTMSMTS
jgi:hypothetical protein